MQQTTNMNSSNYEQPRIIESFEELEVLGDAPGIAVGGTGSGIAGNEV